MRNWADVLPEAVALAQHRYERDRSASNMRKAGLTLREAGARLGINQENARQHACRYDRKWGKGQMSPIEEYLETGVICLLRKS